MTDKVRDFILEEFKEPLAERERDFLLQLWEVFHTHNLQDYSFAIEFTSGQENKFYQRYTEMLFAWYFISHGFSPTSCDEGPDLKIQYGNKTIWIEIICPEPKGLPEDYLAPPPSDPKLIKTISVPHEEILLRWTAALKEKYEKLVGRQLKNKWIQGYRGKGIVQDNDVYVVAINACLLGRRGAAFYGISQRPYALEAAFPIGPIELTIERQSGSLLHEGPSHRPFILNHNQAKVPTDSFLNPEYNCVSAILATYTDLSAASDPKFSLPFILVHNPLAHSPLPEKILGAEWEFVTTKHPDHWQVTPNQYPFRAD